MTDLYNTTIMCDKCNQKTIKKVIEQHTFPIRSWECPSCKQVWHHPQDKQDFHNFKRLRKKQFNVKLRVVGNSYTVSIPREIIEFEEEMKREMENMDKFIRMSLEEPDKLSLFFNRRMRKLL